MAMYSISHTVSVFVTAFFHIHCVPKTSTFIFRITLSKITDFNDFWCVKSMRKFDINNLYICSPHLYTVASLPWEIQKCHFSTVLFIHTSGYLRYLKRKQTVTPLPNTPGTCMFHRFHTEEDHTCDRRKDRTTNYLMYFHLYIACLFMAALCNRGPLYFCPVGLVSFYLSIFFFLFFSSPNLSGHRLDVYHTLSHGVALVRI